MATDRIQSALRAVRRFIGPSGRAFRNEAGDLVVLSGDEMREVRFDFNDPSPHDHPHMHVIDYKQIKTNKIPDPNRRLWPSDVPKR
jgi:hypothetical protein